MKRRLFTSVISGGKNVFLLALAALVAMSTIACDEGGIGGADDVELQTSRDTVNFPEIYTDEIRTESVQIENAASGSLELWDIELVNEAGQSLTPVGDWPTELTLQNNEFHEFTVEYAPQDEQTHSGYIVVHHNDSGLDSPVEIPVTTQGFNPQIQANPSPVDFGQRPGGSQDFQFV